MGYDKSIFRFLVTYQGFLSVAANFCVLCLVKPRISDMSGERTEVERLLCRKIEVKETGEHVTLRDTSHAKANHCIKESRPYFPNEKLRTYIDCPNFLNFARWIFVVSLLAALVAVGWPKVIPIIFFVVCLLFFIIYCQHENVNRKSLPLVLKQPVFDSQRTLNSFYEVTVTELNGVALQNYQAGVGFIELSQGKIKFQAFNRNAIRYMSDAQCQSRLMLVLFLAAAVYNCYFFAGYP